MTERGHTPKRQETADLKEIENAIDILFFPGQVVEIRVPGKYGAISGYFDDHQKLAKAVKCLSDADEHEGVYYTLNVCHEALRARRNKNVLHRDVKYTTSDAEIVRYRWMLVDFDPKRPKGVSLTEAERLEAKRVMRKVLKALRKLGWPWPVIALSGNGWHLLFHVDQPNNPEMIVLFKKCLKVIAEKFTTEVVDIDPKVYNPSRITKAYGSIARKGEDTGERPHRFSKILYAPKTIGVVTRAQLEAVANTAATTRKSAKSRRPSTTVTPEKVDEFLALGGIDVKSVDDTPDGGTKWILTACPFNPEHTNAPAVFLDGDGVLGFHCFHAPCGDKKWSHFRVLVEEKKGGKFNFGVNEAAIQYEGTPAGIVWHKANRAGEVSDILLTNFKARIITDVTEDDGIVTAHVYEIEAVVEGRKKRITLTADELSCRNWPLAKLGGRAVLLQPGATWRDRVRAALQIISTDMEERTVFTHTGWRKVDGEWLYLHADGAISAEGLRDDISVSLPADLERFRLPAPPNGARRIAAVRASLRLLTIAPHRIMVPACAAVWRAVLGNPGFSQVFAGPTGTYKSSCAALCQAHFGAEFDWAHLPGSWRTTANANAELQFRLKDAVFTVDDFVPKGSQSDVQRMHLDADKILRGAANNAGRGRLGRDSSLRDSKPPRCFTLSTGEDIPRGASLQARLWITDFSPGEVDFDKLKACADDAAGGMFAQAMSAFLEWLAPRYESTRSELPRVVQRYREAATRPGQHAKAPQMVAELAARLKYFLTFARETGALTADEAKKLFKDAWRALVEGAAAQTRGLAEEEPAQRFVNLICSALVSARDAHLGNAETGRARDDAMGRCIGWVSGDKVFLDPDNTYAVANELAKAQGEALSVDKRTLWKRLRQRGFLACSDKDGHNTVVRKIGLRRQRVLCIWKRCVIQPAPGVVDASSAEAG